MQITIITLVKNDSLKFLRTLKSIKCQKREFPIEWIIIDGSNNIQFNKITNLIKKNVLKEQGVFIKQINSKKLNIEGIYPCMNYGKKICNGKFIIFLNSGDTFFNKNSLVSLYNKSLKADIHNSLIFGQAKIIADKKIYWFFPGKRLTNIRRWLKYFEPNHQAMLVSKTLANKYDFPTNIDIISDGYWKRAILNKASEIIYIKKPITKFFLDGVSSTKPSNYVLKKFFKNKKISFLRKFIFLIKYLFPKKLFFIYHLMQKYKSILLDFLIQ